MAIVEAVIVQNDEHLNNCGDYKQGSAKEGKAIIRLNLNFLALDAVRRYSDDAEAVKCFGAEFIHTLAHELFHVAQDAYGHWISEAEVAHALRSAREFLKDYQYVGFDGADEGESRDELLHFADLVMDYLNSLPVEVRQTKEAGPLLGFLTQRIGAKVNGERNCKAAERQSVEVR